MKTLKKLIGCMLLGIVCAGLGFAGLSATTYAAQKIGKGIYELNTWQYQDEYENNDVYKKADVTGDGKNDVIEIVHIIKKTVYDNGFVFRDLLKFELHVNGKKLKTWNHANGEYADIQIVTLSNKKSYLLIKSTYYNQTNKNTCGLYQVKNNKLKSVLDCGKLVNSKLLADNHSDVMMDAAKVKKNTIYANTCFNTKSLGYMMINLQIKYSGGKLVLQGNAGSITSFPIEGDEHDFTASKAIQTVKTAGSSKKGIKIPKGTLFSVQKAAVTAKNIYVQVKTQSGKSGWIKMTTGSPIVKYLGVFGAG